MTQSKLWALSNPPGTIQSFKLPSSSRDTQNRQTKGEWGSEETGESKEGVHFVSFLFHFHKGENKNIQTDNEAKVTCGDSGHQQEQQHDGGMKLPNSPMCTSGGASCVVSLVC